MRRLTKEIANGNVGEQAGFDARMYAKSGSYCLDYNTPPTRLVPGTKMHTHRFVSFKSGSVSVVGPAGRLPA